MYRGIVRKFLNNLHSSRFLSSRAFDMDYFVSKLVKNNSIEAIDALIDSGFNCTKQLEDGITILHLAVMHNKNEIAKLVVSKDNLFSKDHCGNTPVSMAIYYQNWDFLDWIKENVEYKKSPCMLEVMPYVDYEPYEEGKFFEYVEDFFCNEDLA